VPYERLSVQSVEENLTALDYAIFKLLPDEGSTLGFHPLKVSVQSLAKQLTVMQPPEAPAIQAHPLARRLTTLQGAKLIVPVRNLSGRPEGWQRTNRAAELLNEKGGE
jgi:hypothetical protein